MKTMQKISFYIVSALLLLPLFAVAFISQPVQAYKCTGSTNNQQHYYREGACYQPVGNNCLDDPEPAEGEECQNRDTSDDVKIADEKPVKNDGTSVANWQCASGTYNEDDHSCETCVTPNNCTATTATPTPSGQDTTTDPEAETPEDEEKPGGEGECAGEKTDYFACDADGADAIVGIIRIIIIIVSVGVGIIAVGGIVYGAILYAAAQDNQDQIRKAISVIRSVVIGLLLYIFMVTILNFLVPGGVFTVETEEPDSSQENANGNEAGAENNSNQTQNGSNTNTGNGNQNNNASNNSGNN